MNGSTPVVASNVPQVHDACESVARLADRLIEVRAKLEERLVPVLRPMGPVAAQPAPGPTDSTLVPVAGFLSESCKKLRGTLDDFTDILSRLEV